MMKMSGRVDCRIADLRAGMWTQGQLVNAVRKSGRPFAEDFDRVMLSKAENGIIILIQQHVEAVADVIGCKPFDLYPDLY